MDKKDCYVISLNRPSDKIKYLKKFNLNPIWVKGINGQTILEKEIDKYVCKNMQKNATKGMIGCAMSHMKLWEYIIKKKLDHAIIFEDDIVLTKNFKNILAKSLEMVPVNYDILYLGGFGGNSENNIFTLLKFFIIGSKKLPKYRAINKYISKPSTVTGIHGYIISYKGAKKALSLLKKKVNNHIDVELLSLYCDKKLENYISNPRIAFQTSTNTMTSLNVSSQHPYILNKLCSYIELDKMCRLNYGLTIGIFRVGIFDINIISYIFLLIGIILAISSNKLEIIKIISTFFILFSLPDIYTILKTDDSNKKKKQIIQIILHYILIILPLFFKYFIGLYI